MRLPFSIAFLLIVWIYLSFRLKNLNQAEQSSKAFIQKKINTLGPWSRGELGVCIIFCVTAIAWISRSDVVLGSITLPGWSNLLGLKGIHDGTVAMAAAILLFLIPVDLKKGHFLLDWHTAKQLPWGILILFGGGFALAAGFQDSGLSQWIGQNFYALKTVPPILLTFFVCLALTFLTEVTSNTATTATFLPILAATASALQIHPYLLMLPATLSASCAFMLPVATPPNAIVFGSGYLSIPQMAKAGFVLNVLGAILITLLTYLWAKPIFGIA